MEDKVDETYEAWLQTALRTEQELRKKGAAIERVPVDLAEFDLWCTVHQKKRDGAARAAYVCERINRKLRNDSEPSSPYDRS